MTTQEKAARMIDAYEQAQILVPILFGYPGENDMLSDAVEVASAYLKCRKALEAFLDLYGKSNIWTMNYWSCVEKEAREALGGKES